MTLNIIFALLFLGASVLFAFKCEKADGLKLNNRLLIFLLLFAAFLFRLVVGYSTVGYETDITLFKAWGESVNTVGYEGVYNTSLYLDYPPGFLYILGWMDKIRTSLGWDFYSQGYTLLVKLPSIIGDIICAYVIYHLGSKKLNKTESFLASALYLFCPAVLINSTVWGQADSWCLMILLFSLWLLLEDKLLFSGALYGLSVITKPQMLIFAPVYLFYTLYKKNFKGLGIGVLSALVVILVVAKPYTSGFDYGWLIERYKSTMDYYDYYSINAYNFWDMIGKNWGKLPESGVGLFVLNWFGPCLATALCAVLMWFARKERAKEAVFPAAALLMFTVYIFSVKMHERYVFPSMLFILLSYFYTKNRDYLFIFSGLSFFHFLNVSYVLYLDNSYVSPTSIQIIFLSAAHVLVYIYFVVELYFDFVAKKKKAAEKKTVSSAKATAKKNSISDVKEPIMLISPTCEKSERKITKKDLIICGVITLIYAAVAFYALGDRISANTSWEPKEGESVVLEASEDSSGIRLLPGISTNGTSYKVGCAVTVEQSTDGKVWNEIETIDEAAVYEWKEIELTVGNGKYIRVTALDDSVVINEIGFVNAACDSLVGINIVSDDSGTAEKLTDEQNAVPLHSSYMNSTYFDEIYHARTAYEFILGVESYENTHPTLGKLIISLGIRMFGMNPFGWRFMGTLFGVLMLPILYHFLKRLFGNSVLSAAGIILFAFDFMHFTQTRIATIDTYAVFFMLLMYDAMLVFVQKDITKSSIKELLIPLFLSGIFMGVGCASKWTCVYAAVGLAVMYFVKLFANAPKGDKREYLSKCYLLCAWCVGIFIVIPCLIYFAAFLPLTLQPQNRDNVFGNFISYQTHMYNYHKNLVAEHYFASPWYEWPFDIRNIWYAIDYNVDGKGGVSSITCLGDPILWWFGLVALIFAIPVYIRKRRDWSFTALVGFAAAYVPWTLVPRLTFIYHYFTAVPWLVISLIGAFKCMESVGALSKPIGKSGVLAKINVRYVILAVFTLIILVMFAVFYPVLSGRPTTSEYIHSLEWLPHWYFG